MCAPPSLSTFMPPARHNWRVVIPILFLEFIVIAMPGGVLPIVLNDYYGKRAYLLLGYASTVKGTLAFLASPAIGALSDVLGRKHLFLACIIGTASPYAVLGLGASLDAHIVLVGLSGALAATFPLAFAYIADSVPARERSSAFGSAIGLGMGGAFLVGPAIGTALEHALGTAALWQVCLWTTVANGAFSSVCMRESTRPAPPPRAELLRRSNPLSSFAILRTSRAMRLLAAITFFYYFALWGFIANKGIYARRRFGQTSGQTAAQLTVFGAVAALSQSAGLTLARRHLTEAAIARACFSCAVASMLLYGVAWAVWMLYPAMALLGLSLGGFATVSSICSQVVPPRMVGEAQGVLASMKAVMEGVGPLAFAVAMSAFEQTPLPGAPWLFGAAIMGVSLALCFLLERYTEGDAVGHDARGCCDGEATEVEALNSVHEVSEVVSEPETAPATVASRSTGYSVAPTALCQEARKGRGKAAVK